MVEKRENTILSAASRVGGVADPYRTRLDPEMVHVLICTKDWVVAASKSVHLSSQLDTCNCSKRIH